MRISTAMIHEGSVQAMQKQQSELLRTQQQLSSGQRMLAPSDDPIGASQALTLRSAEAITAQYATNQSAAQASLSLAESSLGTIGELLNSARTLVVNAGNGSLTNSDRQSIAIELRGMYKELLGLANSRDGQGRFLFAGFQDGTAPFSDTAAGVVYNGDQGRPAMAVSGAREMPASDNGHSIFELGRSGNGVFETSTAAANTGSGIASVGLVYDASLLTGHSYRVDFAAGAARSYSVIDVTAGTTLSAGNAYASGTAIRFDGIEISLEGAPAAGDSVNVVPSTNQSIFKTLSDAITTISTPYTGAAGSARFATQLGSALAEIDSGTERVLTVRSEFGSYLSELETLRSATAGRSEFLARQRAGLEDLDYAKAASELSRQQLVLEAAQRTYAKVSSMSLFNYLG
ncbi:MAG: flagellar hook-associated protein FlgL [Betaproteobacteria bacterium]|nr:flagellar hook-associated protein FlgL [Betaproteobacteria bacterium]